MTDRRVIHPVFGISRMGGDTTTCSKCGHTIPEDHVPLMMWDNTGHVMWVWCDKCDELIADLMLAKDKRPTIGDRHD